MAATELVRTTRLTLCLLQALSTASVPSTAGRIISSSCFGASAGNGLATWWTYVQPFTALNRPFGKTNNIETIDVKHVDPKNKKKRFKTGFYTKKIKHEKTFNKKCCWQISTTIQIKSNITVLVSYSEHDNVWELWLFIREFPMAVMLNSSS